MTTSDLERQLVDELRAVAATTTVAPDALATIVAKAEGGDGTRRVLGPVQDGPWRTRLVVVAAVAVLAAGTAVLVGQAGSGSGSDEGTVHIVDHPPTQPPALVGRFAGAVDQIPCQGDCVGGILEGDLARPDHRGLLPGARAGSAFLPDGRRVQGGALPESSDALLVDSEDRPTTLLGQGQVWSLVANERGDLAMLVQPSANTGTRVRTIPAAGGELLDTPLPDWLSADAVDIGDDGSLAVVGREEGDSSKPHLYLINAARDDYADVRFGSGLEEIAPDGGLGVTHGPLGISISPNGTFALSGSTPEPLATGGSDHPGWTAVIDRDGNALAVLPEWQGLAWAPDGNGLLTARRTGTRTSELRVWYGRDLAGFHDGPEPGDDDGVLDGTLRHLDVDEEVSPPIVPLRWGPPDDAVDRVPASDDVEPNEDGLITDGQVLRVSIHQGIGVIGFPWVTVGPPECVATARLSLLVRDGVGAIEVGVTSPIALGGDRHGVGIDDSIPEGSPRVRTVAVAPGQVVIVDVTPLLTWARANLPETETVALALTQVAPPDAPLGGEVQVLEVAASESGPGPSLLVERPPGCTA